MVTPETILDGAISIPQIVEELQAMFNDQYPCDDEAFGERGEHFDEIEIWR